MEFFVGTLMPFPYNYLPQNFLACNGQLLSISAYTSLYSLIGTRYGGDGRATFALPRLNSTSAAQPRMAVMGQGQGPGLTLRSLGEVDGVEQVTLISTEMPQHAHNFVLPKAAGAADPTPNPGESMIDPGAAGVFVANGAQNPASLSVLSIAPAGANMPHENRQPFLELYWCICYAGAYPQRPSV